VKGRLRVAATRKSEGSVSGDVAVNLPLVQDKLAIRAVVSIANLGGYISTETKDDFNDSKVRTYRFKVNANPADDLKIEASAWVSRITNDGPAEGSADLRTRFTDDQRGTRNYEVYNLIIGYDFDSFSAQSASDTTPPYTTRSGMAHSNSG
jgi:iron complex outermembrane recepter protein